MKLTTLMLSDLLVDRPGVEPGLAACKAAMLAAITISPKRETAAKQTTKKQTYAAVSEYNYNKVRIICI